MECSPHSRWQGDGSAQLKPWRGKGGGRRGRQSLCCLGGSALAAGVFALRVDQRLPQPRSKNSNPPNLQTQTAPRTKPGGSSSFNFQQSSVRVGLFPSKHQHNCTVVTNINEYTFKSTQPATKHHQAAAHSQDAEEEQKEQEQARVAQAEVQGRWRGLRRLNP